MKATYRMKPFNIPCGQCIGCRLDHARQWSIRCMHESQYYEEELGLPSSFITLTFDPKIKNPTSLNIKDFQNFMKRLRRLYPKINIKYYHSGEYGDKNGRPHYHALIFGVNFDKTKEHPNIKKRQWGNSKKYKLYTSSQLQELWPYGYSIIGNVTFETASYTARYVLKKITGDKAEEAYSNKIPEYATMSRGEGIGKGWFLKYKNDVYPNDYVVSRGGFKSKPPRYYDSLLTEEEFLPIQKARKAYAQDVYDNINDEKWKRLKTRQRCKTLELERVIRNL